MHLEDHVEWNSLVQQMISEVNKTRIENDIQNLTGWPETSGIKTRYRNTQGWYSASDYIFWQLYYNCSTNVVYKPFYAGEVLGNMWDIECTLNGNGVYNNYTIILAAHYDSMNWEDSSAFPAPGADSNAAGVAALLEAARVLSNYSFNGTIKFVIFDGSEVGRYGSILYANEVKGNHVNRVEHVTAVINLDQIGYIGADGLPIVDMIGDADSEWLLNLVNTTEIIYSAGCIPENFVDDTKYSDHSSFYDTLEERSLNAIWLTEDWDDRNPDANRDIDTIDKLDMSYITNVTQLVVASIARLASPIEATVLIHYPVKYAFINETIELEVGVVDPNPVTSVKLYWNNNGSSSFFTEAPMTFKYGLSTDGIWNYTLPKQMNANDDIHYYIHADGTTRPVDGYHPHYRPSANTYHKTHPHIIDIRDYPPEIVHTPVESADYGEEFYINATLKDEGGVVKAGIFWKDVFGFPSQGYYFSEMTLVSGNHNDGLWSVKMDAQFELGNITYHVYANDTGDQWTNTTDYALWIIDSVPPVISHIQTVFTAEVGDKIPIEASVTDNYGTFFVDIYYIGTEAYYTQAKGMERTSPGIKNSEWYGEIPAQKDSGTLYYYLIAFDKSNVAQTDMFQVNVVDTKLPQINFTSPGTVPIYEPIDINVSIKDKGIVKYATLCYGNVTDDNFTATPMTLNYGSASNGSWNATIPGQNNLGNISYYIIAFDGTNEVRSPENVDSYHEIEVIDITRPVIFHEPPESVEAKKEIEVNATVTDDVRLSLVVLSYFGVGEESTTEVAMKYSPTTGKWYANISAQNRTGNLSYSIRAVDSSGNEEVMSFNTTAVDVHPPVINVTGSPKTVRTGEKIKILVVVTDDIQVLSITLFYRSDEDAEFRNVAMAPTGNPDEFEGIIPKAEGKIMYYYITASDGTNLGISPLGLDIPPENQYQVAVGLSLFVYGGIIAGIVAGAVAIWYLWNWRRYKKIREGKY